MIKGVLLDLGGVVFVGDDAIPGAIAAIERLRERGVGLRFITNTTRQPLRQLRAKLARLGLDAAPDEIFMPAAAAQAFMQARGLIPHLLVHPDLLEDFAPLSEEPADAVVVGDAGELFTYGRLNAAFRMIDAGAAFLALAANRTFRDGDGELSLDSGPFVTALEFAARRPAIVLGKPSPAFFQQAVASLGLEAAAVAMVGDDVEADVGGAMAAGLAGFLVRTGKYQAGDETKIDPAPTGIADDLAAVVAHLLGA